MANVKCKICDSDFEIKEYNRHSRKICDSDECKRESRRLAMEEYRKTDRGKAMVRFQNLRYKRPETERECFVCGGKFMSARRRNSCDKCIEDMVNNGAKNPNLSINMKLWRQKNPLKVEAHWRIGSVYRDRRVNENSPQCSARPVCVVCGNKKTEAHHSDYSKPLDVTFLCKPHHFALHSWDSFN